QQPRLSVSCHHPFSLFPTSRSTSIGSSSSSIRRGKLLMPLGPCRCNDATGSRGPLWQIAGHSRADVPSAHDQGPERSTDSRSRDAKTCATWLLVAISLQIVVINVVFIPHGRRCTEL